MKGFFDKGVYKKIKFKTTKKNIERIMDTQGYSSIIRPFLRLKQDRLVLAGTKKENLPLLINHQWLTKRGKQEFFEKLTRG